VDGGVAVEHASVEGGALVVGGKRKGEDGREWGRGRGRGGRGKGRDGEGG